jgi:hypothetical protein
LTWAIWINDGVELWGHDRLCKTLSGLPRCIDAGLVEMDLSTQSRKRNVMLLTAKYRQWFKHKNIKCLVKWCKKRQEVSVKVWSWTKQIQEESEGIVLAFLWQNEQETLNYTRRNRKKVMIQKSGFLENIGKEFMSILSGYEIWLA